MHELGIARDLFRTVELKAKENSLKKITGINIALGEAGGIEKGFLEHSLKDHVLPGTIAEGCTLKFKVIRAKFECAACKKEIKKNKVCPVCGGSKVIVCGGEDIYVESIEGE